MCPAFCPPIPLLLVDDDKFWLKAIKSALDLHAGINNVLTCQDPRGVLQILAETEIAAVILDLTMPHLSGEELLAFIRTNYPQLPVIVLTVHNQLDTAVRCMQLGAFDFYVKSLEDERFVAGVKRAIKMREMEIENQRLRQGFLSTDLANPAAFSSLVTCDPKIMAIFKYVEVVAEGSEPVLITGETGTGKELVARAIHAAGRHEAPFVAVNVAGIDDQVFADTLFGHARGAFTGADRVRAGMVEHAEGGTLFLDEIGDLSLSSQVKLLRLLQEREFYPVGSDVPKRAQVRIVAATNHDLAARQEQGRFRRDLYYRLCGNLLHLPPLRERPDDLQLLFDHFLVEASADLRKPKPDYPPEVFDLLRSYAFPGNIRELRSMIFNAMSHHQAGSLSLDWLRRWTEVNAAENHAPPTMVFPRQLPTIKQSVDLLVAEALRRAKGKKGHAAKLLGISAPALSKRLGKSVQKTDC